MLITKEKRKERSKRTKICAILIDNVLVQEICFALSMQERKENSAPVKNGEAWRRKEDDNVGKCLYSQPPTTTSKLQLNHHSYLPEIELNGSPITTKLKKKPHGD